MGAECGFADGMETPPQASRRRSRLGSSTAVAGLARHGICSWRLVPRTPRHMPRRSSRSLGCAVAARRLLPLPLKRQPQPQTLALRSWGSHGLLVQRSVTFGGCLQQHQNNQEHPQHGTQAPPQGGPDPGRPAAGRRPAGLRHLQGYEHWVSNGLLVQR